MGFLDYFKTTNNMEEPPKKEVKESEWSKQLPHRRQTNSYA